MAVRTMEGTLKGYSSRCADVTKSSQVVRAQVASQAVCFELSAGDEHLVINKVTPESPPDSRPDSQPDSPASESLRSRSSTEVKSSSTSKILLLVMTLVMVTMMPSRHRATQPPPTSAPMQQFKKERTIAHPASFRNQQW